MNPSKPTDDQSKDPNINPDYPENLTDLKEHQPENSEDPEVQKAIKGGQTMTRRLFNRTISLIGVGVLTDKIAGGALSEKMSKIFGAGATDSQDNNENEKLSDEVSAKIDAEAKRIAAEVEKTPGLTENEKAMRVVNYTGAFLFTWGLKDLMPGGHGYIHAAHYGALGALTAIKYQLSNEEEKHHLEEETISNLNAFGIIAGSMVAAEGAKMSIKDAYEFYKGEAPDQKSKIALMTMLSSFISPTATTIASSGIVKEMSNELAGDNQEFMAAATSHISNLSGFIGIGDPPFIAIKEKYGFEGMWWQLKAMSIPAMYSFIRNTYKMNLALHKGAGMEIGEAKKLAKKDTTQGIWQVKGVFVKIILKSARNIANIYGEQLPGGLQNEIGEVMTEKFKGALALAFSDKLEGGHHHESQEGLTSGTSPEEKAVNETLSSVMEGFSKAEVAESEEVTEKPEVAISETVYSQISEAANNHDYAKLAEICAANNIPNAQVFIGTLKDFHDNKKVDNSDEKVQTPKEAIFSAINPVKIYQRTTDVGRIKESLGHNLGDVINVFPFQAGCVPFLVPVFKDLVDTLEGMPEMQKEILIFFMIMIFSMFADNYVACKIGLEILPNKPQIPLMASIIGGSMSSIGNMANVAQFSLDKYPLMDSLKNIGLHTDVVTAGLLWSQAVGMFGNLGGAGEWMFKPPAPLKAANEGHEKKHAEKPAPKPEQPVEVSRRDFLNRFRKASS